MGNNFKKIYLTLLWIITLIVVCIGIAINFGGWFDFRFWKSSETVSDDYTFAESDVKNIKVDMDAGSLRIMEGDELKVTYQYPELYAPKVSLDGDTLKIEQKIKKVNVKNKDDYYLYIYVPSSAQFDDVKLNLSFGELRIENMTCENLSVNNDCGSTRLESVKGEEAEINASLGEIRLENCEFDSVDADADMGDVRLDGDFNSVAANCDLGSIDITTKKSTDQVKFRINNDLGKATVNGKTWQN